MKRYNFLISKIYLDCSHAIMQNKKLIINEYLKGNESGASNKCQNKYSGKTKLDTNININEGIKIFL